MFLDEARLAALLHHQNIAQVYDIGREGSTYFFSMEYLHGHDVRALLKHAYENGQTIPLEHTLTIVSRAAAGLHHAHELRDVDGKPLQIVHRDVSPANLFVTCDGGVKLVDFGIARAAQRSTETRTGSLKGKISYMSPEQCIGRKLDRRSDIFSLGIVLYELSTVSRLFRATQESDYVIMDRIVKGRFPPPSAIRKDYPPELEAIVMRALAIDPDARYQTAQEMLLEIERYAADARLPLSPTALANYVVAELGSRPDLRREVSRADDGGAPTALTIKVDPEAPAAHAGASTRSEYSVHIALTRTEDPGVRSAVVPQRRWLPAAALGVAAAATLALLSWRGLSDRGQSSAAAPPREQPVAIPLDDAGSESASAELTVDAGAASAADGSAADAPDQPFADAAVPRPRAKPGRRPGRRPKSGKLKKSGDKRDPGVADELIDTTW